MQDSNDEIYQRTALHYAAEGGYDVAARALIDACADVRSRDKVSIFSSNRLFLMQSLSYKDFICGMLNNNPLN